MVDLPERRFGFSTGDMTRLNAVKSRSLADGLVKREREESEAGTNREDGAQGQSTPSGPRTNVRMGE